MGAGQERQAEYANSQTVTYAVIASAIGAGAGAFFVHAMGRFIGSFLVMKEISPGYYSTVDSTNKFALFCRDILDEKLVD